MKAFLRPPAPSAAVGPRLAPTVSIINIRDPTKLRSLANLLLIGVEAGSG
jgi:hypothetical protein